MNTCAQSLPLWAPHKDQAPNRSEDSCRIWTLVDNECLTDRPPMDYKPIRLVVLFFYWTLTLKIFRNGALASLSPALLDSPIWAGQTHHIMAFPFAIGLSFQSRVSSRTNPQTTGSEVTSPSSPVSHHGLPHSSPQFHSGCSQQLPAASRLACRLPSSLRGP
jgi:hypothetical protein